MGKGEEGRRMRERGARKFETKGMGACMLVALGQGEFGGVIALAGLAAAWIVQPRLTELCAVERWGNL